MDGPTGDNRRDFRERPRHRGSGSGDDAWAVRRFPPVSQAVLAEQLNALVENVKFPPVPPELVFVWMRQLQDQGELGPDFLQLRPICGKTISQLLNEAEINAAREIDAPRDQSASSFTLPPSSYTSLFAVPEQEMQIRQPLWSIPEHERRAPQPTRGGKELPEDGQPPGLVQAEVLFNNPNDPA